MISVWFQLGLFQAHPRLKQFVRAAIEHAVQELLHPVVERSIKIALTTCEQIVKKVSEYWIFLTVLLPGTYLLNLMMYFLYIST